METTAEDSQSCPRILLVEDDADQRSLITESLTLHYGGPVAARLRAVGSAAECRQLDPADFDCILLDYNLPDATGLQLLDEILARADVPVIFVTGENVIATAAEAIRHGAQDYLVKLGDYLFAIPVLIEKNLRQHRIRQQNQQLQTQLHSKVEEVRVKNLQLKESLAKLAHMAATDYLTGLANRRHFADLLERHFSEARRYEFDLTCVMIDLDNYKTLNDTLGHQMGDKILMTAAKVIQANLRASDMAARYGGDEFVLLLPHTSVELGLAVAERIRRQMALTSVQYLKIDPALTLSMGLANLHDDRPASADAMVAMADKALYAAKDAGRNCLIVHGQNSPIQAIA